MFKDGQILILDPTNDRDWLLISQFFQTPDGDFEVGIVWRSEVQTPEEEASRCHRGAALMGRHKSKVLSGIVYKLELMFSGVILNTVYLDPDTEDPDREAFQKLIGPLNCDVVLSDQKVVSLHYLREVDAEYGEVGFSSRQIPLNDLEPFTLNWDSVEVMSYPMVETQHGQYTCTVPGLSHLRVNSDLIDKRTGACLLHAETVLYNSELWINVRGKIYTVPVTPRWVISALLEGKATIV